MLDNEQLDYINSLKETHPDVDKKTLREALLESEWSEIEIMEALSLYSNNKSTSDSSDSGSDSDPKQSKLGNQKQSGKGEELEEDEEVSEEEYEEEPVVMEDKKSHSKLVSIITALLIVFLFLVLVVVGSLVFFEMTLAEFKTFVTEDLVSNITEKF